MTIMGAIEKRSHEPIFKTDTKNKAKGLGATTLANMKNNNFMRSIEKWIVFQNIFLHFWGTNNIFVDFILNENSLGSGGFKFCLSNKNKNTHKTL